MSDSVQIVIAICGVITAVGVPFIALLMAQLNAKQAEAAKQVKDVKDALKHSTAAQTDKMDAVTAKLDSNTATTEAVNTKADSIVKSTDGTLDALKVLVGTMVERVAKLEEYNHQSTHRLNDAVHAMHLKLAELVATTPHREDGTATRERDEP